MSRMTSSVLIMNSGASHRGLVLFMKIMTPHPEIGQNWPKIGRHVPS